MKLTSIEDLKSGAANALIVDRSVDVAKLWDELLQHEDYEKRDDRDERPPGIHASELCKCKRQVIYTLFGTKKVRKTPLDMQKRFNVGKALHDMIQSDFGKLALRSGGKIVFRPESRVDETDLAKRLFLSSSCDGLFEFYREEKQVLNLFFRLGLEIKSQSPDDFEKTKKPKQDHIEQAHLYMACFDLPVVWFIYWNKGNQNYTRFHAPWVMTFDQGIWDKQEKRALECIEDAEAGRLPDKEEGYHCTWCPYAHTCEPSTVKKFAPNQPLPKRSILAPGGFIRR